MVRCSYSDTVAGYFRGDGAVVQSYNKLLQEEWKAIGRELEPASRRGI